MKLYTPEKTKMIDADAENKWGIPSIVLMENAGRGCTSEIIRRFPSRDTTIIIVAGPGNNGGDGFVVARHLSIAGYRNVRVFCIPSREKYRGDALVNLEVLLKSGFDVVFQPSPRKLKKEFEKAQVIVDALFGTGLNSPLRDDYAKIVEYINDSGAFVVSVDIPSGVHGRTGEVLGVAVKADLTVTFAVPKVGLYSYPGRKYAGEIVVAHIGIPGHVMETYEPDAFAITSDVVRDILRERESDSHKGTFGHALLIGGSPGKCGAVMLMGMGALHAGAGLVTAMLPLSEQPAVDSALPEVMTVPVEEEGDAMRYDSFLKAFSTHVEGKNALACGPGLGIGENQKKIVKRVISEGLPCVLDADALNNIRDEVEVLRENSQVIITPHPGEMSRLCGLSTQEIQRSRVDVASQFAKEYGVVVVLKGAGTVVASPDGRVYINTSGNHGMASGGMGDVLTGIIAGLLAQRYNIVDAAVVGVFIHGFSADLIAGTPPVHGYSASDVARGLKDVFRKLYPHHQKP